MLYNYLTESATLIAVILPLMLSLAFLVRARKTKTLPRWYIVACCVALLPVSYSLSSWTFSGYHPQNVFLMTLVIWCARKEITAGVAYALVYFHTAAVDIAGSFVYAKEHFPAMDGWYNGIGGAGIEDLLVLLPVLAFVSVKVLTWYIGWRARPIARS